MSGVPSIPGPGPRLHRPDLTRRLGRTRITVLTAPAGSGKTTLLRAWLAEPGRARNTAWIPRWRDDHGPAHGWLHAVHEIRRTDPAAALVHPASPAPGLHSRAVVDRLIQDLAPLDAPLWLVLDDVHDLPDDARQELALLIRRAPAALHLVLAARHDLRLGLHRPRLDGELTELRADDLRFTLPETAVLLAGAGIALPAPALAGLHARTEGWAAGLRLAALSLAGHPDPAAFATAFTGTERTVADYLLAEVLDRLPADVHRLLLHTALLDRVNGDLADLLTGGTGGARILHDLERTGAFVTRIDPAPGHGGPDTPDTGPWYRYHQLFADLLRQELRRTAPAEAPALHLAAAGWFAERGHHATAIAHTQAAGAWHPAARMLIDAWPGLYLDGRHRTVSDLLAAFPAELRTGIPGLAAMCAVDALVRGLPDEAAGYGAAARGMETLPAANRPQADLLQGIIRLEYGRRNGDLTGVATWARRIGTAAASAHPSLGPDLRALALISLGTAQVWTADQADAADHLARGAELARRAGRPYLEFTSLAHQARLACYRVPEHGADLAVRALALADRHGWDRDPAAVLAHATLGMIRSCQARLDEALHSLDRAEHAVPPGSDPTAERTVTLLRGFIELARGRHAEAAAAFRATEDLGIRLTGPNRVLIPVRSHLHQELVHLGDHAAADALLAPLTAEQRDTGEIRIAVAAQRLATGDPAAALRSLAPVNARTASIMSVHYLVQAQLLAAVAHDALGDPAAADTALERSLDLAEPDGLIGWHVLHPAAPALLARHTGPRTAHGALVAEILARTAGGTPAAPPAARPSESELRVLRYLPTHLTAPQIAAELSVSHNTVKTHLRNLYAKLGTRTRRETVARARDLGLLAPRG